MDDAVAHAVEQAHAEIWRRFIDPREGTFYDYAGLGGEVFVPTPEDCRQCRPNALAWWSPIENGAFFGGLYLDALCNRSLTRKDDKAADKARAIAAGLVKLARVGRTPGFVARGVSTDGRSHYPIGSDDQTFPWFYGLWRYLKSGLPAAQERALLLGLLKDAATALEESGWQMPTDRPGMGYRGSFAEANFIHAARLLFVLRAMHDLTADARWLDVYGARRSEKLGPATRLDLCEAGAGYEAPGPVYKWSYPVNPPFWISASSQAALRGLVEMEDDAAVRARYQAGLDANAASASAHVARYRQYDNDNTLRHELDWRFLNELWAPQATVADALETAHRQVREWDRRSPRRRTEGNDMREPLWAAWVVVLSNNRRLVGSARADICAALRHYRWEHLYTSLFFMAECVWFQHEKDNPVS